MLFSVMNVFACVCAVFLSRIVVILAIFFNIVMKREVWLAIKPGSTHHFFLKMSCSKSGIRQLLSKSSFLCMLAFLLHFSVPVVPLFSSYSWCVTTGFCFNPDLFSLNRLMTYEFRYTMVAFFLIGVCLFLYEMFLNA